MGGGNPTFKYPEFLISSVHLGPSLLVVDNKNKLKLLLRLKGIREVSRLWQFKIAITLACLLFYASSLMSFHGRN